MQCDGWMEEKGTGSGDKPFTADLAGIFLWEHIQRRFSKGPHVFLA